MNRFFSPGKNLSVRNRREMHTSDASFISIGQKKRLQRNRSSQLLAARTSNSARQVIPPPNSQTLRCLDNERRHSHLLRSQSFFHPYSKRCRAVRQSNAKTSSEGQIPVRENRNTTEFIRWFFFLHVFPVLLNPIRSAWSIFVAHNLFETIGVKNCSIENKRTNRMSRARG